MVHNLILFSSPFPMPEKKTTPSSPKAKAPKTPAKKPAPSTPKTKTKTASATSTSARKAKPQSTPKPRKTSAPKVAVKTKLERSFSVKQLEEVRPLEATPEKKKVPTWIVVVFIFSLVFFFFALYKAFIYGQGYDLSPLDTFTPSQWKNAEISIDTFSTDETTGVLARSGTWVEANLADDPQLIQNFYSYLTNNQISEMNNLVDRPLKNSTAWLNHWNQKNIQIFTKHLADTVLLQDVFLIPGSMNTQKQTRQYSYTLKYTIQPDHHFEEEWQVTLATRDGKTLISEIMCKTEGCSRSPFFWPQNYNLK